MARRAYDWQEAVRLARYEREVAPEFQLHVTCSELDKERLRHVAPGAESCVIPNGVDIEYFSPRRGGTLTPTFVFVGTLGWGPNRSAAEMIAKQLWPALANEWPRATMHLVGSNPPESARELAARDRRFIVTGFVDDVRPYMADASFFVCPIRDGGGTKLKILNAMSMQKVVIADPIACEGINAVTGAEVVLATTSDDYVRAVHSLLADPARYHAIAEAARQRVAREYSYEVIGRDMDRRYQAVREAFLSQR